MLLGIVGTVVMMRQRQRRLRRKVAHHHHDEESVAAERPRVCPTCREEYPSYAKFCSRDGNRLVPGSSAEGEGPLGGICPVCGQGYDPGVAHCPLHHEPVVPVGVYRGRSSVPPGERVCPVCGVHYHGSSRFCGNDGSNLVALN
jgi:predicted amidophosphoribosyltransferase